VAAYDFTHNRILDLADTGLIEPVRSDGTSLLSLRFYPDLRRHSAFLSGRFRLSDRTQIHADSLYTSKGIETGGREFWAGAASESFYGTDIESRFVDFSLGLSSQIGAAWNVFAGAASSRATNDERIGGFYDFGGFETAFSIIQDTQAISTSLSLRMDGPSGWTVR
jgi:hypothetical protein